jgi:hypothetical protein
VAGEQILGIAVWGTLVHGTGVDVLSKDSECFQLARRSLELEFTRAHLFHINKTFMLHRWRHLYNVSRAQFASTAFMSLESECCNFGSLTLLAW